MEDIESHVQTLVERLHGTLRFHPAVIKPDKYESLFEDNPEEYVRNELESSDMETEERAAWDLMEMLIKHTDAETAQIVLYNVDVLLQNYAKDPNTHWESKVKAIRLVIKMAIMHEEAMNERKYNTESSSAFLRGEVMFMNEGFRIQLGTTNTNELIDATDFFKKHILTTLQSTNLEEFPVLKVESMKYYIIFRNQISKELVLSTLPHVVNFLLSQSPVVHMYAAHAIERIFTKKVDGNIPCFERMDLQPIAELLLKNLFAAFEHPGSSKNEYIMRAIMRTFYLLQEDVVPFLEEILPKLAIKINEVIKDPSRRNFNHYLFETLGLAMSITCSRNRTAVIKFEEAVLPFIHLIVIRQTTELFPYFFQFLSIFLEFWDHGVPDGYLDLFPVLSSSVWWEQDRNIPGISRLLQTYLEKEAQRLATLFSLDDVVSTCQESIDFTINGHEGLLILQRLMEKLDEETLNSYFRNIFFDLYHRLKYPKTREFVSCLLSFLSFFSYKFGPSALISHIDAIEQKNFSMFIEFIIEYLPRISGNIERKICSVGMIKLLTECPEMIDGCYSEFWGPLLETLVNLLELPEDEIIPEDEPYIDMGGPFYKLLFVKKPEHDPINGHIPDVRRHLAQSLKTLSDKHPGKLPSLISTHLSAEASQHLQKYLQAAGVVLA